MRITYLFLNITFFLLFSFMVNAQINPGTANGVDTTQYTIGGKADSIFVFNVDNSDHYLEAVSPSGTIVDFDWYFYNPQSDSYEFLKTESDTISRVNITESMGFRLTISGGYESRFWVLINDYSITITTTDEENKIQDGDVRCGLITQIKAEIDSSIMYYYHPESHYQIQYHANYQVGLNNWYANPDPDFTMNIFQKLDNSNLLVAVEKPYWDDTWYVLEIEDNFELTRKDSALYESLQPHASFPKPTHVSLDDPIYYPDKSDRYYEIYDDYDAVVSAPAIFLMSNESENADSILWIFGDSTYARTQDDTITHTYYLPGTYHPRVVVYKTLPLNLNVCVDTFPEYDEIPATPVEIVVDNPAVIGGSENDAGNWPNVFTPPNGETKYFRFTGDVSITNFEISIFNRYGKRVYRYRGNVRDWEGWNGKYKNSDKVVSTGVYYYVIREMHELPLFDPDPESLPDPISSEIKRGFFHVYNTE